MSERLSAARELLDNAEGDLRVVVAIQRDPLQHDTMIGYHAQQAIEKALKALLLLAEAGSPKTHDLTRLIALVEQNGYQIPAAVHGVDWLTPWAVGAQYGEDAGELDRKRALADAQQIMHWASSVVLAAE